MYGLVNKAVQTMVCTEFGTEQWERIKQKAGVEVEVFQAMTPYDDAITYALVGAASEVLELPADAILRAFGRYWVRYSADEGYGHLLQAAGSTVQDFLLYLDDMHARVGLIFPGLKPPSFQCTDVEDDRMTLHYYSDRAGLGPFVIGLVEGLGERFGQAVEVEWTRRRSDGADHEEYALVFAPVAA